MTARAVFGFCPMGCGSTLFLADGGHITCSAAGCPSPGAAGDLLADQETDHIVVFGDEGYTVRHPLRERLDDALMTCGLHQHIAGLGNPAIVPGRYRARGDGRVWSWEGPISRPEHSREAHKFGPEFGPEASPS